MFEQKKSRTKLFSSIRVSRNGGERFAKVKNFNFSESNFRKFDFRKLLAFFSIFPIFPIFRWSRRTNWRFPLPRSTCRWCYLAQEHLQEVLLDPGSPPGGAPGKRGAPTGASPCQGAPVGGAPWLMSTSRRCSWTQDHLQEVLLEKEEHQLELPLA